jgi:hypothetical protein
LALANSKLSQILLPDWQSVFFQLGYITLAIALAAATSLL